MEFFKSFIIVLLVIALSSSSDTDMKARVESCKGCRLNRLPEVKAFIFEDLDKYNNVEFKPIPGASPIIIFLNKDDQEIERIDLAPLNRQQCNDLLVKHGFSKIHSDL